MNKEKLINLSEYTDELYFLLEEALKKEGWVRKDIGYFEYKPNPNQKGVKTLPDSWIVFYPDLLEYEENGKYILTTWFKSGDKSLTKEGLESIEKAIKPFHDEDYSGNDIWIHPLYPKGYWQNHALG
jgi:hypothetical protein